MDPKEKHTAAMAVEDEGKVSKKKSGTVCGFPVSIFFIVINEFCERFSYYGMRGELLFFISSYLHICISLPRSYFTVVVSRYSSSALIMWKKKLYFSSLNSYSDEI
ncbi:Solute carrier family 15 member 1 [Liparis tanakae]|uniref:Solute carrier family 15 member 1 n=1 Tax=Liparis tanakae TaxID=230148 RepID=A0A4Z2FNI6_9TELE|nr:Solute carrier family 15 member 1 [Liparis tanakae]